jgi:hypothetical protein
VVSGKKKWLFERYFFQIAIKYSSEEDSESERRDDKFKKSAKHKSEIFQKKQFIMYAFPYRNFC